MHVDVVHFILMMMVMMIALLILKKMVAVILTSGQLNYPEFDCLLIVIVKIELHNMTCLMCHPIYVCFPRRQFRRVYKIHCIDDAVVAVIKLTQTKFIVNNG